MPPPDSTEALAARLKTARRARGFTQEQLARELGLSRSAVAQWETSRAGQLRENLVRLAAVLGVSVSWLLRGMEEGDMRGDELALLRLYRALSAEDRAELLRLARRLARYPPSPKG